MNGDLFDAPFHLTVIYKAAKKQGPRANVWAFDDERSMRDFVDTFFAQ